MPMEGNKWLELNSSSTRVGQSEHAAGEVAPPPEEPKNKHQGGLSTGAKVGLGAGALAVLGLGGFIAFSGGGGDEQNDTVASVSSEDDLDLSDALAFGDEEQDADTADASDDAGTSDDAATTDGDTTDGDTDAAAGDGSADADADPTDEAAAGNDTTDDAAAGDGGTADQTDDVAANPVSPDSPPSPPGAPQNHSVLAGGKLYMRGILPSTDVQAAVVTAVEQVMGPGNAISEHTIDPTVPFNPGEGAPTYIAETVLFQTGSAEIAPDFFPLLGLGVTLLQVQPNVQIEVIGHTDSRGDEQENLELSQARVEAVKAWYVANGGDGTRVVATGKGEAEPIADNETPEGRQLNRRVEFIISGFEF